MSLLLPTRCQVPLRRASKLSARVVPWADLSSSFHPDHAFDLLPSSLSSPSFSLILPASTLLIKVRPNNTRSPARHPSTSPRCARAPPLDPSLTLSFSPSSLLHRHAEMSTATSSPALKALILVGGKKIAAFTTGWKGAGQERNLRNVRTPKRPARAHERIRWIGEHLQSLY